MKYSINRTPDRRPVPLSEYVAQLHDGPIAFEVCGELYLYTGGAQDEMGFDVVCVGDYSFETQFIDADTDVLPVKSLSITYEV